jgi:hypothetical protein
MKVESCQSVCKEVEKTCPFLIKGLEDDKAAGNPSFLCKGKHQGSIRVVSVAQMVMGWLAVLEAGGWNLNNISLFKYQSSG